MTGYSDRSLHYPFMRTDCNSWQNHTIRSKLSKDNYVPTVAIGDELFIDIYSSEGDRE